MQLPHCLQPLSFNFGDSFVDVMVCVSVTSDVDCGFDVQQPQAKDYQYVIGICYISAKHVALMFKNKDINFMVVLFYIQITIIAITALILGFLPVTAHPSRAPDCTPYFQCDSCCSFCQYCMSSRFQLHVAVSVTIST